MLNPTVCVLRTGSLVFPLARRVTLGAALARPLAQRPNLVNPILRGAFSLALGALCFGVLGGCVSDSGRSGIVAVSCRNYLGRHHASSTLHVLQRSRL